MPRHRIPSPDQFLQDALNNGQARLVFRSKRGATSFRNACYAVRSRAKKKNAEVMKHWKGQEDSAPFSEYDGIAIEVEELIGRDGVSSWVLQAFSPEETIIAYGTTMEEVIAQMEARNADKGEA